jgi:Nuclease-related domain
MTPSASRVRIFIGEPIRYESERMVLKFLHEHLSQRDGWVLLLANFNAGGTQFDLLVATQQNTLIVEAKTYALPVRGGINGSWQIVRSGKPKATRNAYLQALAAKNAARDVMRQYVADVAYPDAMVCVPKGIPEGSDLPAADFKVGIGSLQELVARLDSTRGFGWDLSNWEKLVLDLRLQEVDDVDAATSEDYLDAQMKLTGYREAFLAFYDRDARYVPDEYRQAETVLDLPALDAMVQRSLPVLLRGPSGCGKSLAARKLAVAHLRRGGLPLFVGAKSFDGTLRKSLDNEIGLLSTASSSALLRAARLVGAPLLLIVDGYNECDESFAVALTRGTAAFAMRYAGVLVTSQVAPARADLLALEEVIVQYPSPAMKRELACLSSVDAAAPGKLALLELVSSGLEAVLVGQVGGHISSTSSRSALYDAYARHRLGVHAFDGVRALCALARLLMRRASSRISSREFDRLLSEVNVSLPAARQIEAANLIVRRANQVSFAHELFFAFFAAEDAIRVSGGNKDLILKSLNSPRYHIGKSLLIGAFEDQALLYAVLSDCEDSEVYAASAKGECGPDAKRWVVDRIEALFAKMSEEAQHVRFELGDSGWHGAHIHEDSTTFSPNEVGPFLPAIAHGISQGDFLEQSLSAIARMDAVMAASMPKLAPEAREKKIPLRSAMFADAYVMSRRAGVAQLVSGLHSGALSFVRESSRDLRAALEEAWPRIRTAGEFYFLINLTRYGGDAEWTAPFIVPLVKDIKRLPYHLQLDVLNFVLYLREAEKPYRSELIEALQASLDQLGVMMNSVIFEALGALGALDESGHAHLEVVKTEIAEVLASSDEAANQRAYGIFSCQFDHPFDSAYWEVINELAPSIKCAFLTKAVRGATDSHSFFLDILIRQLADFSGDAVGNAISAWTTLPPPTSFMPQNSLSVFFEAHAALGKLGCGLPPSRGAADTLSAEALLACGDLTYWASRQLKPSDDALSALSMSKEVLLREGSIAAAGALMSSVSQMLDSDGKRSSLVNAYPDLALGVCRRALPLRGSQVSFYAHGFRDGPGDICRFVLQVIGRLGDQSDIPALRELCDDPEVGEAALRAIRRVEDRLFGVT